MTHLAHPIGEQVPQQRHAPTFPLQVEMIASPMGPLRIWTSDLGLCAVAIDAADDDQVQRRFPRAAVTQRPVPSEAAQQITAYFAGERADFDLAVDLRNITPFRQIVLQALCDVAAGQVCSYGDLAARIGTPRGARAVGNALGRNPIPIVVPCHRVLAAGGGLGGYTGGLHRKTLLLRLEKPAGVVIPKF